MIINFQKLSYSYPNGDQPALVDVNWSVEEGQFVLVAGPSAAGKSTLIRVINGLVPHFTGGHISGHVEVAGHDVVEVGPSVMSHYIGFVFQNPEAQMLLENVEEEIAFTLENAGLNPEEIELGIERILTTLDMQEHRYRSISHLSGGERQRVAIATALVQQPPILVLDEPTSQLDPKTARLLMEILSDLNQRLGLTIVLTEHRLERVVQYCDRFTYLESGHIVADGPTREVLAESPAVQQTPLARLSAVMGWEKTPLSTREARSFVTVTDAVSAIDPERTNGQLSATVVQEQPVLQSRSLSFSFASRPVLHDVNFSLAPGEAVAIIGPNASGKSTFLKCLVGLLRPKRGEIILNGESTRHQSVAQICRQIAYLPQFPDDLLFADSVRDELTATLANHMIDNQENESFLSSLLQELDLTETADAYPRDLSVGQRQRVALGAVSVTKPMILLLDEPTRGLDYSAKSKLSEIWNRWKNNGMALVIVTHDMELAARVADRVVILEEGTIQKSGTVNAILGSSDLYSPQIARLFPGNRWLTVRDVIEGLSSGKYDTSSYIR